MTVRVVPEVRLGDCLDVLPALDECADLIYVDPPFFTQQEWKGHAGTFSDQFEGMQDYCFNFMYQRLLAMRWSLKPHGVLAVHADDHAIHYLRVLLDGIFEVSEGPGQCISVVAWKRSSGQGNTKRGWQRVHDTIVFYAARPTWTFNEPSGDGLSNLWQDIQLRSQAKERVGYPTQKPVALLERIVSTFTNPGDLVVDPMCGSGTTLVAARNLNRRFFGCDISEDAVAVAQERLAEPLQDGLFQEAAS